MSWHDVERHAQQVDAVLARAKQSSLADSPELQADLARYACVLVAGYVEQSVKAIFGEFVRTRASPEVHRYAERRLARVRNPNATDLANLAGDFNPEWRTSLKAVLQDERKAALDSVVANRNVIAHGRSVGIGLVQIGTYHGQVKTVIKELALITGVLAASSSATEQRAWLGPDPS
jgi:protein involved in polysaccharide export with SLBB domain